jgi:hypothetical protein
LLRVRGRALFPNDSDSAKDMVAIPDFEDLPDLFWNGYTSSCDYFCEEWYLFLRKFNRHALGHRC